MKHLSLVVIIFCALTMNAQNIELPNLTKEQMRQDIAFLANAIKDIDPNLPIRQSVTGSNLYQELDSLVNLSNNLNSFEDFYLLANKLLQLTQDQHHKFLDYYPFGIEENNPYITAENIELSKNASQQYGDFIPCCGGIMHVAYISGEYFTFENIYTTQALANDDSLLIPAGAKILSIDNILINDYVNDFRKIDNATRWSPSSNSYYTNTIHHPFFLTGALTPPSVTFSFNGYNETINFVDAYVVGFNWSGNFSVQYFEKDNILYVRIPEMDYEQIDFLTTEIQKYKSKKITKVVIDIRYNDGGSDRVWQSVLSALISEPLTIKSNVYLKNTPLVRNYVTNIRHEKIAREFEINGTKYIDTDIDEFDTISPFENSLNYNGKIYVLVNDRIFSSSLAFVSVCKQVENLVTVGTPTGLVCGRSTTPFFLSLPNSKLIFELVPCIDMTNKVNPIDYYDTKAEVPVALTINHYMKEVDNCKQLYTEDFLYNYDTIFQKVLELK